MRTFSIITPTYNRKNIISDSIDSSLIFNKHQNINEVIIVDDASNDNTYQFIKDSYKEELDRGQISYKKLETNHGVTYAKNYGAESAQNEWLIFLDSDDQLLSDAKSIIINAIEKFKDADVLFFRCIDNEMNLVGENIRKSFKLNLNDYIKNGTFGECLPVIKRTKFLQYKYDSDLRGFEGLSYIRMIKDNLNLYVIKDAARYYNFQGEDRLSTQANVFNRADKILEGYKRYKKEVFHIVDITSKVFIIYKILQYYFFSALKKVLK
tara:strand:+ start:905 stop:1702 length:798 start_codon:yes stop_codon:yes gene_type:complete